MGSRFASILVSAFVLVLLASCGTTLDEPESILDMQVMYGSPDTEHVGVGLMVFDVGGVPAWRCTGTLLAPNVMLTAGHCTFGATGGRVWFEGDVDAGWPDNGYPFPGEASIEFAEIHTHDAFVPEAFFLHDLGLVILEAPAPGVTEEDFGVLPPVGYLDGLATRRGQSDQLFTPVGYGLQSVKPVLSDDLVRHSGTVRLIGVRGTFGLPEGVAVAFTNSPGAAQPGGTCFGDSGGPVFAEGTNTIAAVTSFGLNVNCAGTGGGYRIDQVDDLAWIGPFLE